MSNHSHMKVKRSRSNANREIENALAIESSEHSTPLTSITKSTLHVTPHVPEDRQAMISIGAYHRAERRGFEPGHELEDWFAAELELDQRLMGEGRSY